VTTRARARAHTHARTCAHARTHARTRTHAHAHAHARAFAHTSTEKARILARNRTATPPRKPAAPPPRSPPDLYHVDHFMGGIGNWCREIINCASFRIGPERQLPGGATAFDVSVVAADGSAAEFEFALERQEWGFRRGAWQTKSLRRREAPAGS
jgi:hypothetical protein